MVEGTRNGRILFTKDSFSRGRDQAMEDLPSTKMSPKNKLKRSTKDNFKKGFLQGMAVFNNSQIHKRSLKGFGLTVSLSQFLSDLYQPTII